MKLIRRAGARGHADHGWLKTWHTFSFADYVDGAHMGFRSLRVINEDFVAPKTGFGTHPHRDMEILTYVLEGELTHRDSLGNEAVIRHGDVQRITAGTGVRHSEMNSHPTQVVHLFQVWILPDRHGHTPAYDDRHFAASGRKNKWQVIASGDGRGDALDIRQDAVVSVAELDPRVSLVAATAPDRHLWLQVMRGSVSIADMTLEEGDGLAVSEEVGITLTAVTSAEVMLFDLT